MYYNNHGDDEEDGDDFTIDKNNVISVKTLIKRQQQ